MARKLTLSQKLVLDKVPTTVLAYDDIPEAERKMLEKINDYESLWSDAERYLWDRAMDARYAKN